jgi:hypothetical protein
LKPVCQRYRTHCRYSANVSTELQFFQEQLEKAEASLQKSRDQHAENQRKHREEEARYMDCTHQLQRLADQEVTFVNPPVTNAAARRCMAQLTMIQDSMKEVLRDCLTRLGRFKDCLRQFQMFFDKLRDEVGNVRKNALENLKMNGEDLVDAPAERAQCLEVDSSSI